MRNLHELDKYRDYAGGLAAYGWAGDHEGGVFTVPSPIDRQSMRVIASSGMGWDHVSVSRSSRCPNWPGMEHVKRLFFADGEVCFQLHVAVSDHISHHPYCLHIWRPNDGREIPLPPGWMVGPTPEIAA